MSETEENNGPSAKVFTEAFKEVKGHVHVLEQRVPIERQVDYFARSAKLKNEAKDLGPFSDERVQQLYDELRAPTPTDGDEPLSTAEKRYRLNMLAISRSVKAFRLLEEYIKDPDPEVADWASLALMEARLLLETEFSDEQQIYIATGLGGKEGKMRLSLAFLAKEGIPLLPYQQQIVERELQFGLRQADVEIEQITLKPLYVCLTALVPMALNVQRVVGDIVATCNEYGDFMESGFLVTNVNEFTEESILKEIDKLHEQRNQASH